MPASSGNRSSPPLIPSAGRPTIVLFGLSHKKMLARSASKQPRCRLGHSREQRFHVIGLVPLVRDREDRLQPVDASMPRALVAQRSRVRPTTRFATAANCDCSAFAANHEHVFWFGEPRGRVASHRPAARPANGRAATTSPRSTASAASSSGTAERDTPRAASIDQLWQRRPGNRRCLGAQWPAKSGREPGSSRSATSLTSLDRWSRFGTMSGIGYTW